MNRKFAIACAMLFAWLAPAAASRAVTIVYQEGATTPFLGGAYAGVEDTFLRGSPSEVNVNEGLRTRIVVGYDTNIPNVQDGRRPLLRFNVTGAAGEFSSISSVTLRLVVLDNVQGNALTNASLQAFEVTAANAAWVEGTGADPIGATNNGQSTWSNRLYDPTTPTAWTGGAGLGAPGGGGIAASQLSSVLLTSNPAINSTIDLNIPVSLFNSWVAGTNTGVLIRMAGVDSAIPFYSSEHASSALRPQLIVTGTLVPEPSSLVLMLLGLSVALRVRRPATTMR